MLSGKTNLSLFSCALALIAGVAELVSGAINSTPIGDQTHSKYVLTKGQVDQNGGAMYTRR